MWIVPKRPIQNEAGTNICHGFTPKYLWLQKKLSISHWNFYSNKYFPSILVQWRSWTLSVWRTSLINSTFNQILSHIKWTYISDHITASSNCPNPVSLRGRPTSWQMSSHNKPLIQNVMIKTQQGKQRMSQTASRRPNQNIHLFLWDFKVILLLSNTQKENGTIPTTIFIYLITYIFFNLSYLSIFLF